MRKVIAIVGMAATIAGIGAVVATPANAATKVYHNVMLQIPSGKTVSCVKIWQGAYSNDASGSVVFDGRIPSYNTSTGWGSLNFNAAQEGTDLWYSFAIGTSVDGKGHCGSIWKSTTTLTTPGSDGRTNWWVNSSNFR
jgi:hypothetical protein